MDAKETAARLYVRFYDLVPTRVMHFDLHKRLAQECAIACVEEIMKDVERDWTDDELKYKDSAHPRFWLEVKLELLKK